MPLTTAQKKILQALSISPSQGIYGRTAYPKGMNGHCLHGLEKAGLVSERDGEMGREWSITEAGRAALSR